MSIIPRRKRILLKKFTKLTTTKSIHTKYIYIFLKTDGSSRRLTHNLSQYPESFFRYSNLKNTPPYQRGFEPMTQENQPLCFNYH